MINISKPFIQRPVMTVLVTCTFIFFGIFSYRHLPVSDLPNVEYPTISVSAGQPGGSPEYMANLVATPLERNLASISGLKTMTSQNTVGSTSITLNFDLDVDLNSKEVEVTRAITQTLPDLPPMPFNPSYYRSNPSDSPILFLLLTSPTAPIAKLYEYGHNILSQPLSMVEGVSHVNIYGIPYAVRIQADPLLLMSHQLDLNALKNRLTTSNPNLAAGMVRGANNNTIIEPYGQLSSGAEYEQVVVQESDGTPLFLGNLARCKDALSDRNPYFKFFTDELDQNMIILAISRLAHSNTIDTINGIYEKLPRLKGSLPESIEFYNFYDKATSIIASIFDVQLTLIIALALVVIMIFFYLGKFLETIIPSLVLPIAMVMTFIFMYFLGFSLDIFSLLALTLAIGFMVDDAIVVMENIVRHAERGAPPYQAAMEGSKQISVTVFTMSIALSAVFIPFIWMPGMLGKIFHEFALTLVIAIYCSGFVSLTLNPMLCSKFLTQREVGRIGRFAIGHHFNEWLTKKYLWLLHHSIRLKKTTIATGIACIFLSIFMFTLLNVDFIPPSNQDLVIGYAQMHEGASSIEVNQQMERVTRKFQQNPHQDGFFAAGGSPMSNMGLIYSRLVPAKERPPASTVAAQMMHDLSQMAGVNFYAKAMPLINLQVGGAGSLGNYQYVLYDSDTSELYKASKIMEQEMQKLPHLTGVNSNLRADSPQLNVHVKRDQAGVYGITAEEIESTMQYAYGGGRISTFSKGIDLYDLILEVDPAYNLTADDLDLLYIKSNTTDELIPMSTVAEWEQVLAPSAVHHFNTFPSVTISFSIADGFSLGAALKEIDRVKVEKLPNTVIGEVQGSALVFLETFATIKWLILIAIVVIYILLGVLYESFLHPFTILSALPVAILGGLFTLWIFNEPISLFSAVGLIVLIGLVQKNGIMLVDFALEFLDSPGEDAHTAILEACESRFRPIMMTTLAAMMGALPVAIGVGDNGDINRPLGLVVFGGLLFSQLITLFFTPVVFLYFQSMRDYFDKKKRARRTTTHPSDGGTPSL